MHALGYTEDSWDRIERGEEPVEVSGESDATDPDDYDIVAVLKSDKTFTASERALIEAEMIAAARKAIVDLERGNR